MRRRIAFISVTLLLSGIFAALLHPRGRSSSPASRESLPSAAPRSLIDRILSSLRHGKSTEANPTLASSLPAGPALPEVRIAALRGLSNYGWIQLPRGTPVELLATEGDYLVVRYDEAVVRIHRCIADAGLVIPRTRRAART